jgi:hypothetical protein
MEFSKENVHSGPVATCIIQVSMDVFFRRILARLAGDRMNGKAKVTEKSDFESVADRDGMIAAGIEKGGFETMDRLAELVENRKLS